MILIRHTGGDYGRAIFTVSDGQFYATGKRDPQNIPHPYPRDSNLNPVSVEFKLDCVLCCRYFGDRSVTPLPEHNDEHGSDVGTRIIGASAAE